MIIVNLDPANDSRALPYRCEVNVLELIRASECADSLMLGPNGGWSGGRAAAAPCRVRRAGH